MSASLASPRLATHRIAIAALIVVASSCAARRVATQEAQESILFCQDSLRAAREAPATLRAVYVRMGDGVLVAADIILPEVLTTERQLPTVLILTRYWRGRAGDAVSEEQQFWVDRGFAVVVVDVRGTGASFGVWRYPWSRDEAQDAATLVDWVRAQSWSNGVVVSVGTSYEANTAELVAMSQNPAVAGIVTRFSDFDFFSDLQYPGGILAESLARDWGKLILELDRGRFVEVDSSGGHELRVRPVDADSTGGLLRSALSEHTSNPLFFEALRSISYRDDRPAGWDTTIDGFSADRRARTLERSNVPLVVWASWLDAGTGDGALQRFMTIANPQQVIIGAWSHGGAFDVSPYVAPRTRAAPDLTAQRKQDFCVLNRLSHGASAATTNRRIFYFTMGEEQWKSTAVWPPAGSVLKRWYFTSGGRLSLAAPQTENARDRYRVDFLATTGRSNRWYTQVGGGAVVYGDRASADRHLLTYTSGPLDDDVEITGNPVVTLTVTSTDSDGAFFVYLEDVDAKGHVRYLTEGQLRALHRKEATDTSTYRSLAPHRRYFVADGELLHPGTLSTLRIGMFATSVVIRRGHCIRIAIAGADRDTFLRIPSSGTPVLNISRGRQAPSFVDLPVLIKAQD